MRIITAATVAEVVALGVAVVAAGGGHGSYLPAKLLFPYAMLMTAVVHEIGAVGMLLAVAQFPVYGAAIVQADAKGVARPVLISVCAVHGLMVVVALALADPAFTP